MGTQIRECEKCGKHSDFWTELVGTSVENTSRKSWRLVLCSECEQETTIRQASNNARQHITQFSS